MQMEQGDGDLFLSKAKQYGREAYNEVHDLGHEVIKGS